MSILSTNLVASNDGNQVSQPVSAKQDEGRFAEMLAEKISHTSAEKIAAHNARIQKEKVDPKEEFAEFMGKNSIERMREIVLLSLGITEEQLEAMPADERVKMEQKISQMIEDKIKLATEEELKKSALNSAQNTSKTTQKEANTTLNAVKNPDQTVSIQSEKEEDWLAALGLPENGKVTIGFTAAGDLKMTGGTSNA